MGSPGAAAGSWSTECGLIAPRDPCKVGTVSFWLEAIFVVFFLAPALRRWAKASRVARELAVAPYRRRLSSR